MVTIFLPKICLSYDLTCLSLRFLATRQTNSHTGYPGSYHGRGRGVNKLVGTWSLTQDPRRTRVVQEEEEEEDASGGGGEAGGSLGFGWGRLKLVKRRGSLGEKGWTSLGVFGEE